MTESASSTMDTKMLAGYTVIDFTRVLAGPYCTRLLADLGAHVIKIERPGEGDEIRYTVSQLEEGRSDQSSYFVRINTGKQGIAVDLAHPEAGELVLDLVRKADVLVENFSPGIMKRYGFDAATLRTMKPELVYCSISGFGQTGPSSSMKAYAHLINAVSGMMDLDRSGATEPRSQYLQAADVLAATHAFGAINAALLRHARTGQGATLDISMLECLIASDDITFGAILNGAPVQRQPRVGMVVHQIGNRHMAMQSAGAPHLWTRIAELIGTPELADDPRFVTPMLRREHWTELLALLREGLNKYSSVDEALTALSSAGIPSAPMRTPEESIKNPQLHFREAFPEVDHPGRSRVRVTATPFHIDGKPTHPPFGAPHRIGEHTRQVLSDYLGYAEEKIDALQKSGVIEAPDTH
jgi:CoA:oxalate CoA-transferase